MSIILGIIGLILTIHGLILAWRASILLAIIVFFLPPIPAIFSLVKLILRMDVAEAIVDKFKE